MKKSKSTRKSWSQDMPTWVAIVCALVLGYLVYAVDTYKNDNRSSADDSVEAGVILPVASDKE